MRSISPVIPGHEAEEHILAKNQPEYCPLPALPIEGGQMILTRWRFSWRERLQILFFCDLFLWVWTFGKPFQPVALKITTRVTERMLAQTPPEAEEH